MTQAGLTSSQVLLVGDEMIGDLSLPNNFELTLLPIGTAEGAPIPIPGRGFLTDRKSNTVIANLDLEGFKAAAKSPSVLLQQLRLDDQDVAHLISGTFQTSPSTNQPTTSQPNTNKSSQTFDDWEDRTHQWAWLLLPFAIYAFRKQLVVGLLMGVCVMSLPQPAQAGLWDDLWQTRDQQAQEARAEGQLDQAYELFETADWKGVTSYENKQYDQALEHFQQDDSANGLYNQGNAQAKLGKLEEALKAYEQALQKDPNHVHAKHNAELVKKLIEQQKQQDQAEQDKQSDQEQQEQEQNQAEQDKQSDQEQQEQDQAEQDKQSDQEQQEQDQAEQDKQSDQEQQEQDQAEQDKQSKQDNQDQKPENKPEEETQASELNEQEENETSESDQSLQRWLDQIDHDPGGLLREKFRRESQRSEKPVPQQYW